MFGRLPTTSSAILLVLFLASASAASMSARPRASPSVLHIPESMPDDTMSEFLAAVEPLDIAALIYVEQQQIAPDGATYDRFGASVSLSGDTAIVGAPLDDIGANENQGSAYVFVCTGTTWAFQQQLTAPDGAADD